MADTAIEWTQKVWNPTTGCDQVSPGCDHCYAMTLARRLKGMGSAKYQRDGDPRTSGPGFGLTVHPDALGLPLGWRRPQRIFVNSMSDLFHKDVPDQFIAEVFAVMAMAPQHTFQVLTKRHGRMRSLLNKPVFPTLVRNRLYKRNPYGAMPAWPLPNVWLGVSVEDQKHADMRIPALLDTPAAVRWISAEPLLGPVDLDRVLDGRIASTGVPSRSSVLVEPCPTCGGWGVNCGLDGTHFSRRRGGLDWVVVGGESGPGARPMEWDWARSLRDECHQAGVAYHFKQSGRVLNGGHGKGGDPAGWPEPFPREYPAAAA